MKFRNAFLLTVILAVIAACGQPQSGGQNFDFAENNGSINLPDGFKAVVVADSLGYARHIAVDEDGDLYISLREAKNGSGIVALRDTDGDGVADRKEYFGKYTGTGIDLHNGYLYFGSDTSVVRYPLEEGELVPSGEPETIVGGFPIQNQHATKSITIDNQGNLYVNVGAPSNACMEQTRTKGSPGMDPCPQLERQAGIWKFDANATGQLQTGPEQRFATGIRNAVALEWNPLNNQLYALQHGRDQLSQFYPEMYSAEENAALPAEEFFLVNEGDNFGWPYAYYDQTRNQKVVAPEYGGDGETPVEEGKYEDPIMAFPGHWGPNDLVFYTAEQFPSKYRDGAFIAFHGSWNRAPLPQQGYNIVYVPFEGDSPSGDYEVFADGFKGADTLKSPGNAQYRPTGLGVGPDGSLYVSDSVEGRLWRIVYTGN